MDLLLNGNIDKDLEYLLASVIAASNEKKKNDFLNEYYMDIIVPFITVNYDLSFKKKRNLLHIILYNYNYALQIDDYVFEEYDFVNLVETLDIKDLLKFISQNNDLEYYLVTNYYKIIFNQDLIDLIKDNFDCYENILWLDTWYIDNEEYELVTKKFVNLIFTVRDYCDYSDTILKDDILIKLIKENKDFFNIINYYFNSIEEFKYYKPMFIEMLYLDSYYYLTCEKAKRKLSNNELNLLKVINETIDNNKLRELPKDDYYILMLIECLCNVNFERSEFLKDNGSHLDDIKKIVMKKANKALLLEYC